jgi:hypothetical protein
VKHAATGAASLALSVLQDALPDSELVLAHLCPSSFDAIDPCTVVNEPAEATPNPEGLMGYVFNANSQDVTIFDPTTRQVLATKPLGVVVAGCPTSSASGTGATPGPMTSRMTLSGPSRSTRERSALRERCPQAARIRPTASRSRPTEEQAGAVPASKWPRASGCHSQRSN